MLVPKRSLEIPEETVQVARAAFPKGNKLMTLRDALGPIFEDEAFAELYPSLGQPAESPGRLALVTVLQFMEQLTDREAADAVSARIDWKYALGLELRDPGFHYSVLTEFRQRLIGNQATQLLLDRILARCQEAGLLKGTKKQRTDSTRVLAAIRLMNRVELVGETMRRALDELATVAPEWLLARMQPEWGERYSRKIDTHRIRRNPGKLRALAKTIGRDGYALLRDVYAEQELVEIRTLPAVETLRRIWLQQYYIEAEDVQWREKKTHGFPPARKMIASPDDQDARYGSKDGSTWTGYKIHLAETCEPNAPRLVTHIETTVATSRDATVTKKVQDDLIDRGLEPEVHLADGGYMDADNLISSQDKEIDLVGPVRPDSRWQSKVEGAYDVSRFKIDWEKKVAICPEGQSSSYWKRGKSAYGQPNEHFMFKRSVCQDCHARSLCTRAQKMVGRILTVYRQEKHEALQAARERQTTGAFRLLYYQRSGIEGTVSQAVRGMGIRRSRYRGLTRTHLQHAATAAAINLTRVADWLSGKRPKTAHCSPFAKLAMQC
jgi:transposase